MSHLKDYIDQKNAWAKIFNEPTLNHRNLDHAAARRLFEELAACLSPENLTCDGELDRHTVQQRYRQYTGAIAELEAMGFEQPEGLMY